MNIDVVLRKFVLSDEYHTPEDILGGCLPLADEPHHMLPWIWFTISKNADLLGRRDLFLEFSKRFCLDEQTSQLGYWVGKRYLLIRRIECLTADKSDVSAEIAELLSIQPTAADMEKIRNLGFDPQSIDVSTFPDDYTLRPDLAEQPNVLDFHKIGNVGHFSLNSLANHSYDINPTISVVENVEYFACEAGFSLVRDGRFHQGSMRSKKIEQALAEAHASGLRPEVLGGTAVILSDGFSANNYCHWMLDWLARALLAKQFIGSIDYICAKISGAPYHFGSVALAEGLNGATLLLDCQQRWCSFDRVVLVDNLNVAATHPAWGANRTVLDLVRNSFLSKAAEWHDKMRRKRLYISRADANGSREIVNRPEFLDLVRKYGFEVVLLSRLSVQEQVELFSHAEAVIGVHGAGLTNVAFMPAGSTVIELFHCRAGTAAYAKVCRSLGHHYYFMACSNDADAPDTDCENLKISDSRFHLESVWIDLGALEKTLAALYEPRAIGVAVHSAADVAVVGNCHCLPIADMLSLCGRGLETDYIDVNFMTGSEMRSKIEKLEDESAPKIIFTINLSDQFGNIATSRLRETHHRVVSFTNVHFTGLHPDITYLGNFGGRLKGFFGDYHSKIVLSCYLSGLDVDACVKMFRGATYQNLDYFDEFKISSDELLRRDSSCDVKFASQFLEMIKNVECLYTVNHPTAAVFFEIARKLAVHADLDFILHQPALWQSHLAANYIWPVYNEIAEHHGLNYRSEPFFVKSAQRGGRSFDFLEFVAGSYKAYACVDDAALRTAVSNELFFKKFSVIYEA